MSDEHKIGRYVIHELLGRGNMGSVFRAFDPYLQRFVAIKTIRSHLKTNPKDSLPFKDRFFREAQTNSQLNHPSIVAVYDSGMHHHNPFLVMEYIDGVSLEDLIFENQVDDLLAKHRLLKQIAAGLDYAHKRGVIHRDIKPANILITHDIEAKIVDFGLAKLKDTTITTTGVFLGTPSYASPEQITTGVIDNRADIFSFGILAYELLTGKRPYPGDNINSILYHIVHSDPDLSFKPLAVESQLAALRKIFSKILHKDPDARYQNLGEFIAELESVFGIAQLPDLSDKIPAGSLIQLKKKRSEHSQKITLSNPSNFDETMLLEDVATHRPIKKNHVVLGVLSGMALVAALFILFLLFKGNGSEPAGVPPPEVTAETLNAKTVPEIQVESDPQTVPGSGGAEVMDPPPLSKEEIEQELADIQSQLHQDFLEHVAAKRVREAEATLDELRKVGVDVTTDERVLSMLKSQLRNRRNAQRAAATKKKIREEFKTAQAANDLAGMERSLGEYEDLWPKESVLLEGWKVVISETRDMIAEQTSQAREIFEYSLNIREIEEARAQWARLRDLGAATPEDESRLRRIETTTYTNSLGMKFVRIPAGQFQMGGKNGGHEVILSQDFYLSMFEVTQAQWTALMDDNPSKAKGPNLPVANVSWKDCREFIKRLNQREGGAWYRLPSEAQWEYACRAGTNDAFGTGGNLTTQQANFKSSRHKAPVAVGSYQANAWGLFDMHGNVSEWCEDIFGSLPRGKRVDPLVLEGISRSPRVVRGGSFESTAPRCECGHRARRLRRFAADQIGLRLVRQLEPMNGETATDDLEDGDGE